jgi:hypothetical protein
MLRLLNKIKDIVRMSTPFAVRYAKRAAVRSGSVGVGSQKSSGSPCLVRLAEVRHKGQNRPGISNAPSLLEPCE